MLLSPAAVEPMQQINRVLVPTALDERSAVALRRALTFAGRLDIAVEVLHVVSAAASIMGGHLGSGAAHRPRVRAMEKLDAWMDGFPTTVEVEARVAEGEVVRQILKACARVDLVILSTAGRDEVSDWVFGTKAQRIIDQAVCDVWLIRNERPETDAEPT